MAYTIHELGNVPRFEDWLFYTAAQEWQQRGREGPVSKTADQYIRQKEILKINPFPPEKEVVNGDTVPPSIKHVHRYTEIENLYRWGFDGAKTDNHRLLFVIHENQDVLLLHYFNKTYNGAIRRPDIIPAEQCYTDYSRRKKKGDSGNE